MMEKQIDLMIYDFKNSIIDKINESGLPITILHMIFEDIMQMLTVEQQKQLSILLEQRETEISKQDNNIKE